MTVARTDSFRVIVEIDERDIRPMRVGQRGTLALSALPWSALRPEVTRITPCRRVVDGANIFEVEAKLLEQSPRRAARACAVSARSPPADSPWLIGWTRRATDWVRLWLWTWLG